MPLALLRPDDAKPCGILIQSGELEPTRVRCFSRDWEYLGREAGR